MAELRYALRVLSTTPGFALTTIGIMGLAIGANVAMFSIVNAYLLQPLPYPDPGRLVRLVEKTDRGSRASSGGGVALDFMDAQTFDVALFAPVDMSLTADDTPIMLNGGQMTAGFLDVLGVKPLLGRDITPDEDAVGGDNLVILLTYELWLAQFGGDPDIVGRPVRLDHRSYTVIGVLPPRALLVNEASFLIPANLHGQDHKHKREPVYPNTIFARVHPGVSVAQAEEELRGIRQSLKDQYPVERATWTVAFEPLQEVVTEGSRPMLISLFAAVGLVLLIGCANVANLMLARTATRDREIAIRRALGAGGWRIARLLFAEGAVIAGLGAVLGVLLTHVSLDAMVRFVAATLPRAVPVAVDGRALAFAVTLAGATALVFGALPVLGTRMRNLNQRLMAGGRGASGSQRTQSILIVGQLALTMVLLVGSSLLLRSFINAATTDPGFLPENTLTFDLIRPDLAARAEDRIAFANRALEHFKTLPGITTVGAGTSVPLGRFSWHSAYISVEERPETRFDSWAHFEGVTGDYFGALGLRLLQGRLIRPVDEAEGAAPVIILNETLARQLFGDEEALGRQVHFMDQPREVVGIIGDTRHRRLDATPPPVVYVPYPVFPWRMAVVIRSSLPTAELTRQMTVAVRTLDPEQAIGYVQTLEKVVHESLGPRRSILMLLSGFSGAAVVLAVIGIYALTAYAVTQRNREFSIRIALGATLGNVVGLVLKRALLLGLAGLTVGLVGCLIATRLIANQLYGVGAHDPVVLGAVGVLLVAVILVAAWTPARTAARADPASALRAE